MRSKQIFMKKNNVLLFVFLILFSFFTAVSSFAMETSVLLSENVKTLQISGTEFILTTGDSLATPEITGSFALNYRKGVVFCDDVQYILPVTITSQNPININGVNYKGKISLEENEGRLCIVNYVDVEDYLAGVLACEMSPKWPMEALKAQAVLARTYLQNQGKKHGKYVICDTEHCQVYKGVPKQSESITQALLETKDLFLCYNNKPAQVFFFADSGGATTSSKDVWNGSAIPYLISRPDPDVISQKFTTWKFRCTMSLVQEKLLSKGIDLGTILSITPTVRDNSGRVLQLEIKGQNGTKTIASSLFRSILGAANIKSTLFKFAMLDSVDDGVSQSQLVANSAKPTQKITPNPSVAQSQHPHFVSKMDELMWLSEQGAYTTRELCAMLGDFDNYDTYIKNGYEILRTGNKTPANTPNTTIAQENTAASTPISEDKKSITNESATDNVFMIIGYGNGHGVGMPQNQCKYLAQAGWTYDQILAYYFPGTVLSKGDVK